MKRRIAFVSIFVLGLILIGSGLWLRHSFLAQVPNSESASVSPIPSQPVSSPSSVISPTSATPLSQNQQPIEVISVLEPPQVPNPGGGIVEITLKNVGDKPVVYLTAVLTIRGPFKYYFNVSADHPLLPGESISSQLRLIGRDDGWGPDSPYSVTINGTLQNGETFSYTWKPPNK